MQKIRNRFIIIGLVSLIIISILIFYFFNSNFWALRNNPFGSTKLNILVVGYDSSINGPPRADTIILSSIDLETKEVGLLSIPRDSRVNIPGHGINRINASHAFGGIDLTVQSLEELLDIKIDYFIETDFQGFARIIDAIGGVEIDISEPLKYVDKAGGLNIDLPAGKRRLSGEESLDYVRFREPVKADIGRVERQQKFLKAMLQRILNPDIVMKLPAIYSETKKAVDTNIPIQDLTPFIRFLKDINLSNIDTAMLPGEPQYINNASYYIVDRDESEILINKLIRSKEYIRNGQYKLRIVNGNGVPGQASEFASKMEKYGFEISSLANALSYDYASTNIIYYNNDDKDIAMSINEIVGGEVNLIELDEEELINKREDIQIIIGEDNLKK